MKPLGSLKRVKLTENAESEIVLEHMAGEEYYRLSKMTFFDDVLLINGGLDSIDTRIAVDEDYIYLTLFENIQSDGAALSSSLELYTHDGQLVKEISLNSIENDTMKTVMCSNSNCIFLGKLNAVFNESLYIIEKGSLELRRINCSLSF